MALGYASEASGFGAIAGGAHALASGAWSMALGQLTTASGASSTALGRRASTNGMYGAFVYGDGSSEDDVTASAFNQFVVRAAGGFRFYTASNLATGCRIDGGNLTCTGTVTGASDEALKQDFASVDAEAVLGKVAALPIHEWRYRADAPQVRHLGPTAQAFRAAFGLGRDDKGISMVDADGVSLLSVQALERRTRTLRDENAALRAELAALRQSVLTLEAGRRDLAP
jgi:uncharacterized small protein (DUF1192 family)